MNIKKHKYIINYLTDTDVYKFTQTQVYLHNTPTAITTWRHKIRTKGVHIGYLKAKLEAEIRHLCKLRFQEFELDWFRNGDQHDLFSPDYVDFLERFQLNEKYIKIIKNGKDLEIVAEGPAYSTSWFEIYIMEIIQELYMRDQKINLTMARRNLKNAVSKLNKAIDSGLNFRYADFGARRRYSFDWQDEVIGYMVKHCKCFCGTSNVYFAIKYKCKAIGTFAHELYAVFQGMKNVRLSEAQKAVLDVWTKEYRGNLGIALSDNFGFRAFLRDFDLYYAKLFDGARHDSANPYKWGDMLIEKYKSLNIDPRTKVACFSDSLNVDKMISIAKYFNGRILITFGVGTYFMAEITGGKYISMVMKVVRVNGHPVVKLADSISYRDDGTLDLEKCMCDDEDTINYTMDQYEYVSLDTYVDGDPVSAEGYY